MDNKKNPNRTLISKWRKYLIMEKIRKANGISKH